MREPPAPSPWRSVYVGRLAEVTPLPQSQGLDERRERGGQLPSIGVVVERGGGPGTRLVFGSLTDASENPAACRSNQKH